MYFTSDIYHPQANRSVYSESYFNPKEKINITENRLGCNTFNPTLSATSHTPFGTIKKNRLKLLRNPNFRISFGDGKGNNNQEHDIDPNQQLGQQEQLYVKIGETNPSTAGSYTNINWMQQHQYQYDDEIQQQQQHQDQQQYETQAEQTQLQHNQHTNHIIYQNHRQNKDKDIIYAPSDNRNIINYINSNKRYDDV